MSRHYYYESLGNIQVRPCAERGQREREREREGRQKEKDLYQFIIPEHKIKNREEEVPHKKIWTFFRICDQET